MCTRFFPSLTIILSATLFPACRSTPQQATYPQGAESPLFTNLGDHHRKITTTSRLAQRYFDQGLTWAYCFNHDEAIRAFTQAIRVDPGCAMAWWGIALCHGPHINNPVMSTERSMAANTAIARARAEMGDATAAEQALIVALSARYADPIPDDRRHLDEAYAESMRAIREQFPEDLDIACLTAEAMMDLRPWDLWTQDGQPQPGTLEIVSTLENILARNPDHPGANHLYIHAVEASPHPDRADAAADRLRDLIPGSGHMVHMPAHIDVRTGRWQMASDQNEAAIRVDERYRELSPQQEFYRLYMLHNHHFLAYACMMEGRSRDAIRAAAEMVATIPPDFLAANGTMADPYTPIGTEVLVRFGLWDEVLATPRPPANLPITTALWHQARATALAAKGRIPDARAEQVSFRTAVEAVPEGAYMAINPAADVLRIADLVLEGEIAFREGDVDSAISNLKEAIPLEDRLRYMEPPDWVQPTRHSLGAILSAVGRYAEAETVYAEDLRRWPENGWSLFGMARALEAQGRTSEAAEYDSRFRRAWSRADTEIHASCLCVPR